MALLIISLSLACLAVWFISSDSKKRPLLPPGPPAEPLIGHLRIMPPDNQQLLLYKWGQTYGDIMHLRILGRSVIVLNSTQAANDLLEKRSANYSDRPAFPLFHYIGWPEGASLSFLGYGKQFQKQRRIAQENFNKNRSMSYRPIQTQETGILLQNLLADDEKRDSFVRRFSAAIIIRVVYGHQITSEDD